MKRITYTHFGDPDVLTLTDAPEPTPGPGQVRVRTRLASVNPTDAKIRRGEMEMVFASTFPVCPGVDVAGVIDAVGDGVDGFALGDEVFGMTVTGSYAEYALLDHPVAKPAGLSWEVAAALPTAGETAVRAYRRANVGQSTRQTARHGCRACKCSDPRGMVRTQVFRQQKL